MGRPKRIYELSGENHVKGLKMLDRMNDFERIEGLLERVVVQRFPRVREGKAQ